MKVPVVLALVFLLGASQQATACSCAERAIEDVPFAAAKHVFIFRVLGTEISEAMGDEIGNEISNDRIRIVEDLRGRAPYVGARHYTGWCCGTNLQSGHYYLAVTSDVGLTFDASTSSVIEVSGDYSEGYDNWQERGFLYRLQPALRGDAKFSEVLPHRMRKSVSSLEAPPAPPAPCREPAVAGDAF